MHWLYINLVAATRGENMSEISKISVNWTHGQPEAMLHYPAKWLYINYFDCGFTTPELLITWGEKNVCKAIVFNSEVFFLMEITFKNKILQTTFDKKYWKDLNKILKRFGKNIEKIRKKILKRFEKNIES